LSEECIQENSVITCLDGKLITIGDIFFQTVFDRATCIGAVWFGTTCAGEVFLPGESPFFNCTEPTTTVPTTTQPTTTVPTTTQPTTTMPTTTQPTTTVPTTTQPTITVPTTTQPTTTVPT
ncbi:hypothetical protein PFISCL1PPCAC_4877, partial [Pristionchus fissidentatus]